MTGASPALLIPMRRILRVGLLSFGLVPLLAGIAYLTAGEAAAWSLLMGAAVPWAFFSATAVIAVRTAASSPTRMATFVLVSWLAKMLLLVVFLASIRGQEFYDKTVFGLTLLLATTLMLVGEALIVQRSRTLYVEPNTDSKG